MGQAVVNPNEKKTRDTSNRRQQIKMLLRQYGSVQVAPLARQFQVSTQTIRSDLSFLVERGVAARSYGGAMSAGAMPVVAEPTVELKQSIHRGEKESIGRLAASLVRPGEAIILDSGTTTQQIARHLPENEGITVVTNDFEILSVLAAKEGIDVILPGGTLRRKNMAFYGPQTEAAVGELLADKLFLGVDGFNMDKGITTHIEAEAMLNRKMAGVAQQVIAVTDSSKFGRVCLHRIIAVSEIDLLITDGHAPDYILTPGPGRPFDVLIAD